MLDLSHIITAAAKKTGLPADKLRRIYTDIFDTITDTVAIGETVSIRHLGRFKVHEYPSKSIPDPKGRGHHLVTLPTKVLKFRPSPHFRSAVEVNKGHLVTELGTSATPNIPSVKVATAPTKTSPKLEEHEHEVAINLTPTAEVKMDVPQLRKPVIMSGDVKITQEIHHTDTDSAPDDETEPGIAGWWHRLTGHEDEVAHTVTALSSSTDTTPAAGVTTTAKTTTEIKSPIAKVAPAEPAPETAPNKKIQAKTNVDFLSLANLKVPKEILNLLPELFARRHKAVPVGLEGKMLTVAMVNPEDLEVIQLIQKTTGLDIKPVLSSTEDVNIVLNQYSALETEVANVIKDSDIDTDISKQEIIEAEAENVEDSGDDSPTARIVFSLMRRAVREKASDVHIEPQDNHLQIRFRLDGVLHQRLKLPVQIEQAIIARLKILANLKIDEHRLPQDGRFQLDIDKNLVDFRLSIMPVADGEKAVMRVLDKTQGLLTLEEIGVRDEPYDVIKKNIKKTYGMTLITGPTGSGKTTSLYALLGLLMDDGVNIVTMENPIEYRIAGINQSQVNPDIGYDFADGLRAIVRQDPDIVMVGEIRDKDTAEIAIQSALTGHIVLSTLHTNTASGAFPRLIDMGVEPFLISSSVNTVVAQRLARKICDHCREPYNPSATELGVVQEELAKIPEANRPKIKKFNFFKGKGCDSCNGTGYKGRVGIFEVLDISEEVKQAVIRRATDSEIQEIGVKQGTVLMLPDGLMKAIDGITTLEEVWRVTRD
jgi:type IV pilus assembly protein PilB